MMTRAQLAAIQLPPLFGALVIAELFFKFHSFTLEAIPFLGVWYVLRRAYAPIEEWAQSKLNIERQPREM
jgi:hypothetical protein